MTKGFATHTKGVWTFSFTYFFFDFAFIIVVLASQFIPCISSVILICRSGFFPPFILFVFPLQLGLLCASHPGCYSSPHVPPPAPQLHPLICNSSACLSSQVLFFSPLVPSVLWFSSLSSC